MINNALSFLPAFPPQIGEFGFAALCVLAAIVAGDVVLRVFRLPRITGYVLLGALLGQVVSQLWTHDFLPLLRPLFEYAFGILLFELGQRIDLGWLRRNPWLLATSLAETLFAFVLVGAILALVGVPHVVALLCAGVAASSGPAVVLGVTRESRARGPVTERLQLLTALGTCYAFAVLGAAYAWQYSEAPGHSLLLGAAHMLYLILGSLLLGYIAARAVLWVPARLRPDNDNQSLASIALIVFAIALISTLQLSVTLSILAAGALSRSLDRKRRLQPLDFGLASRVALILVFLSTGALLDIAALQAAIVPVLALIAARALGKLLGIFAFAEPSGLKIRKASLLTVCMLPMSSAALLWVERTSALWPTLGAQMSAIVLSALAVMDLVAPPLVLFALRRADETREAS